LRQTVILARDTLIAEPDGNSVKREETVTAVIEWPEGFKPRPRDGYFEAGNWRIIAEHRENGDIVTIHQALRRAEMKLRAYIGVCKDDKELTETVLPMVDQALSKMESRAL
jgi:hypothetical protein